MAPVALAGAIVLGFARFIVMLSAHADVFGVGITVTAGSILVSPSCATTGCIVPGGGLLGISGVESGKAAPSVGGPPGTELHTMFDGLPSGDAGAVVPVELTPISVGMVPNGVAGVIPVDDIVAAGGVIMAAALAMDVETVLVPVMLPIADMVEAGMAGVPDTICGIGVAQVTNVPGVAGLEASGTGASVVPGVSGRVVAENGPGPVSGDVTITPGVVGIPMAVVPMVETCARLALQPASRVAVVSSKRRIAIPRSTPT
jgi:hypothetical protein